MKNELPEDPKTLFVDVIIPLSITGVFTYRVPKDMDEQVAIGKRVVVQFGKTRLYTALIQRIHHTAPGSYEAKYLVSVLDEHPILESTQLDFWQWISSYYMCQLGEVMSVALPSALKLNSETFIVLNTEQEINKEELSDKEYLLVEALEMNQSVSISDVSKILEFKSVHKTIRELIDKKIIWIKEEVEERYKPRKASFIRLHEDYRNAESLRALFSSLEKFPKQVDILQAWLKLSRQHPEIEKKVLLMESGISVGVLNGLVKKDIFEIYSKNISRLRIDDDIIPADFRLSEEQQKALISIEDSFRENKPVLLHGVTASGKTQLYIRLIEKALADNKQSLFLLPEIALTTQIINRLKTYFGNQVGVYHSRFSDMERVEVWNNVLNGSYKIVLGTRSSLFLPFSNLGLIVIDEEHESSYKQQDPAPRYNARDSAMYLSRMYNAHVVLGSATPSLESYYNARSGKYDLVELHERFGGVSMPEIRLIDLQEEMKSKSMQSHFSTILIDEIREKLALKEQVILFQNRRGYAPISICSVCGYTPKCIHCDVSLTYHKQKHELHCHYCGYHQKVITLCPSCGSNHIDMKGVGTEKIEDELQLIFPEAKIARMDLDSTRTKNAYINLLAELEEGKIDILIGTQMVAKGLDFDNVTMIGIINADQQLNYPDFRSFEKAFQMLTQVSGRAGRRQKTGKVFIQTYQTSHYILQNVIDHNYQNTYKTELNERINFKYPPLYRMIQLTIRHKDSTVNQKAAAYLARELRTFLAERVLGPEIPLIGKIRNYYLNTIIIKVEKKDINMQEVKQGITEKINEVRSLPEFRQVIITPDVDPV